VTVILDTNIVSALRQKERNSEVSAAISRYDQRDLYISVLTVGELNFGIELMAKGRKRTALAIWLAEIELAFGERILDVTLPVSRLWGELVADAQRKGHRINPPDSLIAATALHHGLAVMTRNVRDFVAAGVTVIDPWND
jgi:predicted nucleic acid-binding protein